LVLELLDEHVDAAVRVIVDKCFGTAVEGDPPSVVAQLEPLDPSNRGRDPRRASRMDFDDLGPVLTLQGDVAMVTADRSRPAEALIEFVQERELARLAVERERSRALFKSSVTNRSDSAARNAVRPSG